MWTMLFKTSFLFLQRHPTFDAAWMYSELDSIVLSLAIAVKTDGQYPIIRRHQSQGPEAWWEIAMSGETRGCLFSLHKFLDVQSAFRWWGPKPRRTGRGRRPWRRVRRFGFEAHYSTCHEVEVSAPLFTGRRHVKDTVARSLSVLGDL